MRTVLAREMGEWGNSWLFIVMLWFCLWGLVKITSISFLDLKLVFPRLSPGFLTLCVLTFCLGFRLFSTQEFLISLLEFLISFASPFSALDQMLAQIYHSVPCALPCLTYLRVDLSLRASQLPYHSSALSFLRLSLFFATCLVVHLVNDMRGEGGFEGC